MTNTILIVCKSLSGNASTLTHKLPTVGDLITAEFPHINKIDTLADNDRYIAEDSYSENCRIDKVVELSTAEYDELGHNLLDSRADLWSDTDGKLLGGHDLRPECLAEFRRMCERAGVSVEAQDGDRMPEWVYIPELVAYFRHNKLTEVVYVTAANRKPFVVDPQGYDYARYVGRPC